MKKVAKILKIVLLTALGLIVAVAVAVPIVLNSRIATNFIDKLAAQYVDGNLSYSGIKIGVFPKISVKIDSLLLTYPHDRFSEFDLPDSKAALLQAGRGESVDTLARFDRLDVAVDVMRLLRGRIRVSGLRLSGLAAYAHQYDSLNANWDIIRLPESQKDTTEDKPLSLPWISIRNFSIDGHPHVVYTNQQDTLFAALRFERLALGGNVHAKDGNIEQRHISLDIDSLAVVGRLPADTLAVRMDYLKFREPTHDLFNLGLGAEALVLTSAFGRLQVPVTVDGSVAVDYSKERLALDVKHFDADVAYIPMHAEGSAELYGDRTELDVKASILECPLDTVLRRYADRFVDISRDISTDGRLTVELAADGTLSKESMPHVTACVQMPRTHIDYRPMGIRAFLNLDVDADMNSEGRIDAEIHEFIARIPGVSLEFDGSADDLLGRNPLYKVGAVGYVKVDSVKRFIPDNLGIETAAGRLDMDLYAQVNQSELKTFKFNTAAVRGCIKSDHLTVSMPKDSLYAEVFATDVDVNTNSDGIALDAVFDSVYFNNGVKLIARVRDMENHASVSKVESRGKMVPRLAVSTDNGRVFVKAGSSRFGVQGLNVDLSAQKRAVPSDDRRKHALDSLQRVYPGTPRNELVQKMRESNPSRKVPSYMLEKDFASKDISFSLDSTLTKYIREWSPTGSFKADNGFVATPQLPLRTRLTALDMSFDENDVRIDSLSVTSGTSDMTIKGYLSGALRALVRKGLITTRLNISSGRLNVNELLAALDAGKSDIGEVSVEDEEDESFVTDEFADSQEASLEGLGLIVVPGNIDADVDLDIHNADYAEFKIDPLTACLKMKDRTAQIVDMTAHTSVGDAILNAYYATLSKQDISAGVDLRLSEVSAHEIISVLPSVDDMMPALKSFEGKFDVDLSMTTQIDTNMNVIIPSADGMLRIAGKDLEVKDAGDLRKITRLLMFKNKNIGHIDDLSVSAVVHDSKVEVFPFELGVDRYKLALRGMQGFDRSMLYHVSILKSPFLLRFGINIFGTLDNWRFTLGLPKYREGKVPSYTKELDAVQVNILKSIQNVYDRGVENVREYNASNIEEISKQRDRTDAAGSMSTNLAMSAEELSEESNVALELEFMEQEEALASEVDRILEDTFVDAGKLMAEYEKKTYSNAITRRIEKLKEQAAAKAERKAAKKAAE